MPDVFAPAPHDNKLTLAQRLLAVMHEVDYVQKEKKAGMQYTIVSHDAVTAKVRPALVKHGVIYYPVRVQRSQDGNRTEMDVTVRFVNVDKTEDYIEVQTCGYGIDSQDKGPGKAMSYAVKYALLKALGLETGDDPDTESVDHQPRSMVKDRWALQAIRDINDFQSKKELDSWRAANFENFNELKGRDRISALAVSQAIANAAADLEKVKA